MLLLCLRKQNGLLIFICWTHTQNLCFSTQIMSSLRAGTVSHTSWGWRWRNWVSKVARQAGTWWPELRRSVRSQRALCVMPWSINFSVSAEPDGKGFKWERVLGGVTWSALSGICSGLLPSRDVLHPRGHCCSGGGEWLPPRGNIIAVQPQTHRRPCPLPPTGQP